MIDFKLEGIDAIKRSFDLLPAKFAKKAVRKGLRTGAKLFQGAIKEAVPVDTGQLKKSIKVRAGKNTKKYISVNAITTFAGTEQYYGSFVELGTKDIEPRRFIRDTFDRIEDKVYRATEDAIVEETNKILGEQ